MKFNQNIRKSKKNNENQRICVYIICFAGLAATRKTICSKQIYHKKHLSGVRKTSKKRAEVEAEAEAKEETKAPVKAKKAKAFGTTVIDENEMIAFIKAGNFPVKRV